MHQFEGNRKFQPTFALLGAARFFRDSRVPGAGPTGWVVLGPRLFPVGCTYNAFLPLLYILNPVLDRVEAAVRPVRTAACFPLLQSAQLLPGRQQRRPLRLGVLPLAPPAVSRRIL